MPPEWAVGWTFFGRDDGGDWAFEGVAADGLRFAFSGHLAEGGRGPRIMVRHTLLANCPREPISCCDPCDKNRTNQHLLLPCQQGKYNKKYLDRSDSDTLFHGTDLDLGFLQCFLEGSISDVGLIHCLHCRLQLGHSSERIRNHFFWRRPSLTCNV